MSPATLLSCQRCRASWELPSLTEQVRNDFAGQVLAKRVIEAIRALRETAGIGVREAKATMLHLTRTRGTCHRCSHVLPADAQAQCPKCQSLNLDW